MLCGLTDTLRHLLGWCRRQRLNNILKIRDNKTDPKGSTLPFKFGEVKTRTFYPRTTFCRPGVSRSPLREIFHRVFGITKKYRPTMHPKCAAALADKDWKNLLMFKGRTEVTTHKWEDLHKKRDRRDAVSYCFLHISIRNKPIGYVHPASTNHQGQAVHCRINSFGK